MQENANMITPEDEDEIENIIEDFDQDEAEWEDVDSEDSNEDEEGERIEDAL